jgi:hypothetical protein
VTQYDYYATGSLKTATQPDQRTLSYTSDAAHRLTDVPGDVGNKVTTCWTARATASEEYSNPSDTLAKTISRVFDALERLSRVGGAP